MGGLISYNDFMTADDPYDDVSEVEYSRFWSTPVQFACRSINQIVI